MPTIQPAAGFGVSTGASAGWQDWPFNHQGLFVKKQLFWILCKYGLGLGLLGYVVWKNWSYHPDGDSSKTLGLVTALDKPIHFLPLIIGLVLCSASVLLTFVRWFILVRAQGLPFTLPNAIRLGLIGTYLNTFLPGSVGGDIIKATYIAREQNRRTVAVATVLIDRGIGLTGLFWLVAVVGSSFWAGGYLEQMVSDPAAAQTLEFIVSVALGLMAASLAFWILLGFLPQRRADKFAWRLGRIPKIGHSLAEFWRAVWMYRCRGKSVAIAILLAMIGHVGFVLTFYCAALTLNRPDEVPSLQTHFLLVPVGMSIQAGFPAPGGVGGGEVAFGELYKRVNYPFDRAVLASLTKRVMDWILAFTGYLVYLRMRPALRASAEQARKEALALPNPPPSTNGSLGHPTLSPSGVSDNIKNTAL
jgi:uncharacterized protein (TIRG00374 family)